MAGRRPPVTFPDDFGPKSIAIAGKVLVHKGRGCLLAVLAISPMSCTRGISFTQAAFLAAFRAAPTTSSQEQVTAELHATLLERLGRY